MFTRLSNFFFQFLIYISYLLALLNAHFLVFRHENGTWRVLEINFLSIARGYFVVLEGRCQSEEQFNTSDA